MPQRTVQRHRVRRVPDDAYLPSGVTPKQFVFGSVAENVAPTTLLSDDDWRDNRNSLLGFTKYTFPGYKVDKFHEDVCNHITGLVTGSEVTHLMLFAPPQTGKSEIVSTRLPSFWLAHNPSQPVGLVSYGASLAYRNSRYARMVFESHQYNELFPEYEKDTQNWRTSDWHLRGHKGYILAAGVGGPITGHGFGLGIIDDPVENWAAAQSDAIRESIWQWWLGTFKTRMWEYGKIIFMMCMTGNTRIMMGDGTWRNLDTITPGEIVMTKDGDELKPQEVEAFLPQGKAEILEIKTGNHKVSATGNHPFLVRDKEMPDKLEWIRADELNIGDEICVLGRWAGGENPRNLSEEDAVALGFMFGDGWITHNPNKKGAMRWITCFAKGMNEKTNQRILKYFQEKFDVVPNYKKKARYYRTEVARVGRWFESLGLYGKAKTKRIPDVIFRAPINLRKAFIEGFVLADGSIDKSNRATILINNQLLLKDLKLLAESCGYKTSNINRQSGFYQPPGSPEPIYATSYRFSFHLENTDNETFAFKKIRSIERTIPQPVYDLTVKDTHNFIAEGVVVHNTRWHEDDLAGRILDQEGTIEEGGKWKVLAYPALAESENPEDDILGREFGEALAPSRYSAEYLREFRATQSAHVWNAEYQQHPTAPEGDFFKIGRIEIVEAIPAEIGAVMKVSDHDFVPIRLKSGIRFWDLAASEKKQLKKDPDSTSGSLLNEHDDIFYILDNLNQQLGPYEVQDIIKLTAKVDGKNVKIWIEQEPGSAGKSLIANYVRILKGFIVNGKPATGSKMVRADQFASQVNAGNVKILKAPWNKRYLAQLASFPRGAHDDDVDSSSGAFNELTGGDTWDTVGFGSV